MRPTPQHLRRLATPISRSTSQQIRYHFTAATRKRPKSNKIVSGWLHGRSTSSPDSIYRRTFTSDSGPASFRSSTTLIKAIVSVNLLVFGTWIYGHQTNNRTVLRTLTEKFTLSLHNLKQYRYYVLLTSAFSHRDIAHIAFNMISFLSFGQILTYAGIGAPHIAGVCLVSGVAGSVAWAYHHAYVTPNTPAQRSLFGTRVVRVKDFDQAIGASGMVMGVGAAAACLWPLAPMRFMFIPMQIPLMGLVTGFFAVDAFFLNGGGSIGHSAHLGGAVAGVVYYFLGLRRFGGVWRMLARRMR